MPRFWPDESRTSVNTRGSFSELGDACEVDALILDGLLVLADAEIEGDVLIGSHLVPMLLAKAIAANCSTSAARLHAAASPG